MLCEKKIKNIIRSGIPMPIHSIYRHTVNLMVDGQMIALHPDFIEVTPLSAALPWSEVEFETFASILQSQNALCWEQGYFVSDCGMRWQAGEIETWDAKLPSHLNRTQQALLAKEIEGFLSGIFSELEDGGMMNAAVTEFGTQDSLVTSVLRKQVWEILRASSSKQRIAAVLELIGMGLGLTPSGDDFIVGFLLAYKIAEKEAEQVVCQQEMDALCREIPKHLSRTNDVSGQYLICACEGRFGRKLHQLVNVCNGNECNKREQIRTYLELIKETGHSSGIDTLNGILAGLKLIGNLQ